MRKGDQNGQTFRIDRIRNPGCSLDKDTYNVVKKEFNYFDNYDGKNVFKISFSATTDSSSDDFFNLGYSLCSPGWIEQVFVHDGKNRKSDPFVNMDLVEDLMTEGTNARRCGLATVLTELCLIDPQLKDLYHGSGNKAMEILYNYPDQYNHVQEYCNSLMGMDMLARPKKAAHVYFRAALRRGYRRMLVLADGWKYFWTEDARRGYGMIEGLDKGNIGLFDADYECCCLDCGACDAWGNSWLFCKDV
jgi:hypothetical protein